MRDAYGLVPDHIRARHEQEESIERSVAAGRMLDRALKQKDPRLSCVLARQGAHGPGIKPGYWHVRVKCDPPLADHYIPIQTPDGGYREPDSWVLFELEAGDTQRRPDLIPRLTTVDRSGAGVTTKEFVKPDTSHAEQTADEQRRDEMLTDYRAGKRLPGEGGFKKRLWGRG